MGSEGPNGFGSPVSSKKGSPFQESPSLVEAA